MSDKDYDQYFRGCLMYIIYCILILLMTGFVIGYTLGGDLSWISNVYNAISGK